jgi:ribonuclease HII
MKIILGIDEVGRGPWAGPLVIGAVVLGEIEIDGLNDSKKLTAKKREELSREIHKKAAGIGLGFVSSAELDDIGLSKALRLATRRAVEQIDTKYTEIIIDGTINFLSGTPLEKYVSTLIKADGLIPEVSAASIVAKVARDKYMTELAEKYPEYGFEKHVGYGTAAHKKALEMFGKTPEHRNSFKPVAAIEKNTTTIGNTAEEKVAKALEKAGHAILARNWKTKLCEIDIVSEKDQKIYFTEVKYRKNPHSGSALEAITPEKLQKMTFAAESFISLNKIDKEYLLQAAAVEGEAYEIRDIFPLRY